MFWVLPIFWEWGGGGCPHFEVSLHFGLSFWRGSSGCRLILHPGGVLAPHPPPQTALAFLSRSGLVHGAVGLDAVFVDPGGEWKLGGLEQVGGGGQEPAPRPPNEPPRPQDPPELSGGGNGSGEPW